MIRLGKLEGTLLLSFLLFFSFSLLYIFRSFDNNTLVSWKWVFADKGFSVLLPYLSLGIILSLIFASYTPPEKYQVPLLAVFAGIVVLPLWKEPELIIDSGRYFLQAKHLSEYGFHFFFKEWGYAITAWTDMPLAPFLYGLVLKFGNESRISIQCFNTLLFILTIVVTSKIGTTLWGRELGFYAGLLLTGMPYLLTQVPQMLIDIHAMFFHLLAFYCFLNAMKQPHCFSLLASSLTIVLAIFVKYSTWPLLMLLPLSGFLLQPHSNYRDTFKRIFFIFLPAALVSVIIIGLKFDVFAGQVKILFSYQRPALGLWGEGMVASLLFHCHPFIVLLSGYAVFRACQQGDRRFLIVLLYCSLIILLQIQRVRYMVPLLPFFCLMAAYGLVGLKETFLRRLTVSIILTSSLALLYILYLPFFYSTSMMNIKNAGEALNQRPEEAVEVTVGQQLYSEGSSFVTIPLLDLFTDKHIISGQQWPKAKPGQLSDLSPLLFTWLLTKPTYYEFSRDQSLPLKPVVVITSENPTDKHLLQMTGKSSLQTVTRYSQHSGIFRYRTAVLILD